MYLCPCSHVILHGGAIFLLVKVENMESCPGFTKGAQRMGAGASYGTRVGIQVPAWSFVILGSVEGGGYPSYCNRAS